MTKKQNVEIITELRGYGDFLGLDITTEFLFLKLQEEKKTGELLSLPKDFYFLAKNKLEKIESANTHETDPQIGNFKKLIAGLKEKRKQKILIYLAYNKKPQLPIPEEEERLYIQLKNILYEKEQDTHIKKIKINSDIPPVLTPQKSTLGPYKQNEIIEVENELDADFLIKNKIGELV